MKFQLSSFQFEICAQEYRAKYFSMLEECTYSISLQYNYVLASIQSTRSISFKRNYEIFPSLKRSLYFGIKFKDISLTTSVSRKILLL